MAESDKVFAGSIPKFYDTLMVPLIFEAYAADLAELVAASSPGSTTTSVSPRIETVPRHGSLGGADSHTAFASGGRTTSAVIPSGIDARSWYRSFFHSQATSIRPFGVVT